MNKFAFLALAVLFAPISASAVTIVEEGGGPFNVTSDNLFTGIAISGADGPGTYVIDFFTAGDTTIAVADAAVTAATVDVSFTNLTMSWIDGKTLNTLVSAAGVDTLTTIFDLTFSTQQLVFAWTDSIARSGFRFDVTTAPGGQPGTSTVPIPAAILMLGSALAGLGLVGRRRKGAMGVTA